MNESVDPIFKGCTRPPLAMGVPIKPLIAVLLPLLLAGMWGMYLKPAVGLASLVMAVPVVGILRLITKRDDQRLMQLLLHLKIRARQGNRGYWGAACFAPIAWKKR